MTTDKKTFKYSEIFHSFQGEGYYTGRSTAWIRFFACNLTCAGFGQKDPTDPSTYVEPYKTFDVSKIKRVQDLPVWEYGCDSSYTWSARYKHLMEDKTAEEICDEIQSVLVHPSNPRGQFFHPETGQFHHMAYTGGEPMLKRNQYGIIDILGEFDKRENVPLMNTVETNGTQPLTKELKDTLLEYQDDFDLFTWFWSVSPKLFSTSGEKPERAIKPEVVGQYAHALDFGLQDEPTGQLKYVVNGTDESWREVEEATRLFRNEGVEWDVYIMPVGATKEEQQEPQIAEIVTEAMKRGYHVSPRVHCYVFGNEIGT